MLLSQASGGTKNTSMTSRRRRMGGSQIPINADARSGMAVYQGRGSSASSSSPMKGTSPGSKRAAGTRSPKRAGPPPTYASSQV